MKDPVAMQQQLIDEHPLIRPEVIEEVVRFTARSMAETGGTGHLRIEVDFKDGRALSWRPTFEAPRRPLTTRRERA